MARYFKLELPSNVILIPATDTMSPIIANNLIIGSMLEFLGKGLQLVDIEDPELVEEEQAVVSQSAEETD